MRSSSANVAGLAGDRSKWLLREGWQTHGARVLCSGHTQAAGASCGVVAMARAAHAQVSVSRLLVLVHGWVIHVSVGKITAAAVVERLLWRGLLRLQAAQRQMVAQVAILLLCLLCRHLVQVHSQWVV